VIPEVTICGPLGNILPNNPAAGMLYLGDTLGGAVRQDGLTFRVSQDVYLDRFGSGWARTAW
jgi:hypothetical protein